MMLLHQTMPTKHKVAILDLLILDFRVARHKMWNNMWNDNLMNQKLNFEGGYVSTLTQY